MLQIRDTFLAIAPQGRSSPFQDKLVDSALLSIERFRDPVDFFRRDHIRAFALLDVSQTLVIFVPKRSEGRHELVKAISQRGKISRAGFHLWRNWAQIGHVSFPFVR